MVILQMQLFRNKIQCSKDLLFQQVILLHPNTQKDNTFLQFCFFSDNVMRKLLSMLFEASGGKDYPVQNKNSRICGFVERDPSLVKQNKLQVRILLK